MKTAHHHKKILLCGAVVLVLALNTSTLAFPPDPDNAALLYYQAFLLQKRPDDTMADLVAELAKGKIAPHEKIAQYLQTNKRVIDLATAAAEMPTCNWGLKYSDGFEMEIPHLWQARYTARLIIADARILAANKDYYTAIDRCLTTRKFALHIAKEPTLINWLAGFGIEEMTNNCIRDLLGSTKLDPDTLKWLTTQLDRLDKCAVPLNVPFGGECEFIASYFNSKKALQAIAIIRTGLDEDYNDRADTAIQRIRNADEQFFKRNADYFDNHTDAVQAALSLPYEQAYNTLKDLGEKPADQFQNNPDATLTALLAPSFYKPYNYQVRRNTHSNALRAALEIYAVLARTGQLPTTLPADLPADMFSGRDFQYENQAHAFTLRCRYKDLLKDEIPQYTFGIAE